LIDNKEDVYAYVYELIEDDCDIDDNSNDDIVVMIMMIVMIMNNVLTFFKYIL
jgi:hypothetical protein